LEENKQREEEQKLREEERKLEYEKKKLNETAQKLKDLEAQRIKEQGIPRRTSSNIRLPHNFIQSSNRN